MFCLQLHRPRQFSRVDIPEPVLPGREYILVHFDCALVCGSDVSYFNGTKLSMTFPLEPDRPIHECAGQVVESPSGHFHVGDRVVAMPEGDCGLCKFFLARADEAVNLLPGIEDPARACLVQPLPGRMVADVFQALQPLAGGG